MLKRKVLSDKIIIQQILQGDTRAFRHIVEQHKTMSYSLAVSMLKDKMLAEEAVQDSFVQAFRGLAKFKMEAKLSSWLYRIVYNECLKKLRKNKLEISDIEEVNESDFAWHDDLMTGLQEEEQKFFINKTLDMLSANEAVMLRLFYLSENSIPEINEITGISVTNIKTILHRARKRFHSLLSRELKNEMRTLL